MGTQVRLTAEFVKDLPIDGKDRIIFDDLVKGFGIRTTKSGSKIFIAQRRVAGKGLRVTIGRFPDISVLKARDEARKLLLDMSQGSDPRREIRSEEPEATPPLSFADAVERWLNLHVRTKLKPLTIRDYEKISDALKERFTGRSLESISKADALELHAAMSATKRRANYYLTTLSTICAFNDHSGITAGIKRYRETQRERIMSPQELERVFVAIQKAEGDQKISVWIAGALRFAILTGARPAEITAIEWTHLDHDRQRVVLPDSKANRQRILYTNLAAWTVMTAMPRFGKFVFAGRDKNKPMARLTNSWGDVRKLAGLDDVRLYDARHTFASEAALAGHNLPMIGALLGHTVAATTQRYVHLTDAPASKASQDVGDRMAAAMAGAVEKQGATPIRKQATTSPSKPRKVRNV
ncbi:site-specific integrase [Pseudochrobactrum sp. sp1633]|uniref:tyrosine-type recombinase/integrase n=1 Tax=Pseudochrobactrum sp. sp1633 TaxID=3036706 RepID=UPI0025A56BA4|nr:site-specific integrase [Pseudochrobactrum sp. sp1633]MDM8344156.1 site-specific integrase [Pseudochrobactrum sp. sp1633]